MARPTGECVGQTLEVDLFVGDLAVAVWSHMAREFLQHHTVQVKSGGQECPPQHIPTRVLKLRMGARLHHSCGSYNLNT